jgi:hypothetical protein
MAVRITVVPEQFTLIQFEAARIAELTAEVAERVGFPDATEIRVEVDEQSPLGRSEVVAVDPITLRVESGAFEDAKHPRHLSDRGVRSVVGRLLFRARDRLDPGFAGAPSDSDMPLRLHAAWDVYAVGRCARLGLRTQKERRRYHFRIRHGFTDAADEAFDRLWAADGLTLADLEAVCEQTKAADVRPRVKQGRGR